MKQFLIEFKKLEKCINQQNEREKYKDNVNKEMYERKEREEGKNLEKDEKISKTQGKENISKKSLSQHLK